jgi:DNA invertase Pin-like site-specific DNA recombinase
MILGYVRVSTKEQNSDLQIDAMKKAGVEKFFEEKMSSIKERPQLDAMLEFAREGDTIVVWKFDRIARSSKHFITMIEELKERKIKFISLTEAIDTSTPYGNFFLQLIGAFAELERNIIIERTNAGLKAARKRGKIGGRKKGLSPEAQKKAKAIKRIYEDENRTQTIDEICKMFGNISRATLYRYLRAEKVPIKYAKRKRRKKE